MANLYMSKCHEIIFIKIEMPLSQCLAYVFQTADWQEWIKSQCLAYAIKMSV